jgi:hypothetical protein
LGIVRFWSYLGELRGGVAVVVQRGHALAGFNVVFTTRHVGDFDFDENVGWYALELSRTQPGLNERDFLSFPDDPSTVCGFCIISRRQVAA